MKVISTTPKHAVKRATRFPISTGKNARVKEAVVTRFGFEFVRDSLFTSVTTREILSEFEKNNLLPATRNQLSAFNKKYGVPQSVRLGLTALGSKSRRGRRQAVTLRRWRKLVEFEVDGVSGCWDGSCRFLAIIKPLTRR